jgi:hydrogenase-4 component B
MNYFSFDRAFSFDPLSLFFIFVVLLISIPSAVFSIDYLKEYTSKKKLSGWVLMVVFVLSMLAVVTVTNTILFLIAWEIMSLVSYFLVMFDSQDPKSVKAGIIYIVMTHIGTAFITVALLTMYKYSGSFDFIDLKHACSLMPAGTRDMVFLCFLMGFGTKAGVVPLHVWLPYAHPQAPSHISSLMSGVMIKTAIYGLIRFVIMIVGVRSGWWGNLVLILASVTCLVGVMYAVIENDIKKLLAYSSVENIGIILLGVGASMVFLSMNQPVPAVFALAAGLYHIINHAIFKSLLFLCSGSVYSATGLRNIEKLGGLAKKMRWTSFAFLVGAMAISALPPMNGFVSEWLTLQALFTGVVEGAGKTRMLMGLYGAVLALTGGLAAACFVKAFGVTFLAAPRSDQAKDAKESSPLMVSAMMFLALAALLFGVFAAPILKVLTGISGSILAQNTFGVDLVSGRVPTLSLQSNGANLSIPALSLVLLGVAGAVCLILILIYGKSRVTANSTWGCGYYKLDERTEYTGTAFSKPFRIAFDFFYRPYRKTEEIKDSQYYVRSMKYETSITPIFKKYFYRNVINRAFHAANFVSRLQSGSIHFYIAYIFITLMALLYFVH